MNQKQILLRYVQNHFEQAKVCIEKNLPPLPPGRTRMMTGMIDVEQVEVPEVLLARVVGGGDSTC